MEKFIVKGGKKLQGSVRVSGAKNVALKVIVAACLTDEEVTIHNIPLISDFFVMVDIVKHLGGTVHIDEHTIRIQMKNFSKDKISLEKAAEIRTSVMFIAPMLARLGKATIPNPGGCRIGARPIDRVIDGLQKMGIDIVYDSTDGYFHAHILPENNNKIQGVRYRFKKNTHTGTETLLIASVLAEGKTILKNVAMEPEVDELITFLNQMGAKIKRKEHKIIEIEGVEKLHSATITIGPDRNEVVTIAIAAILTKGEVLVEGIDKTGIEAFLQQLTLAHGKFEEKSEGIRFSYDGHLLPTNILTAPYPGFMTDWQSPWAVLMTMADGESTIHEAVYESRFGYVAELNKMGADIKFYQPSVANPHEFYNFNLTDDKKNAMHAIRITGSVQLHNAAVQITDLRAGATLVLAALAAQGESIIFGLEHVDRGYEQFEERLQSIGADIKRVAHE